MSGVVRIKKDNLIAKHEKCETSKNKFVAVVFFIGLIAILAWIGYGIYMFAKHFKFISKTSDKSISAI